MKIGDKVVLKSGGPKMTIKDISEEVAICEWGCKDEISKADFKILTLNLVESNESDIFKQALEYVANQNYVAFKDLMKPALKGYIKHKNQEQIDNFKQDLKDRKNLYK